MRRRSRYDDYGGWPAYVPVAQRRANAKREVAKLRKKGKKIQPVEIEGRTIARSFWGKGWCSHLESFGDYSNRLPRGRTYARNGSVCHLGIAKGEVEAIVSGSELYRVTVDIAPLKKKKWTQLKQRCAGKIGSLIELLQGRLSESIMETVTDRDDGLFPLPGEIKYDCNCPDWADMCKHIAAVMYGIGARLDQQPELLFLLRGVDHEDLISTDAASEAIVGASSSRTRRRTLTGKNLENVFGVDLDDVEDADPITRPVRRPRKQSTRATKATRGASKPQPKQSPPFKPTARKVANLRKQLGLSKAAFAREIGVSAATITNWEKAKGAIRPNAKSLAGLTRLYSHRGKKEKNPNSQTRR